MSNHVRAAEVVRRMKLSMPVYLTMTDPFTGQPYVLSKENLLALLALDVTRLTFEGQVVPALHAEIARAQRACEGEAIKAEVAYRKWKAQIATQTRAEQRDTKLTEKAVEESYRTKPEYETMSEAPERWNLLARLFGDLKDSVRLKGEMIKAQERSLDAQVRSEPSETIDRLEEYAREANASDAPKWQAMIPTGAPTPPPQVIEEQKTRGRRPRKEIE